MSPFPPTVTNLPFRLNRKHNNTPFLLFPLPYVTYILSNFFSAASGNPSGSYKLLSSVVQHFLVSSLWGLFKDRNNLDLRCYLPIKMHKVARCPLKCLI